jgi:hypothetical protein
LHWRAKLEDVLTSATGNDVSTFGLARFDSRQNQPRCGRECSAGLRFDDNFAENGKKERYYFGSAVAVIFTGSSNRVVRKA